MRFRHFRGRKIHSPFVYGVVRECLMGCSSAPVEQQIAALGDYLGGLEHYSGEAMCVVNHRGNRAVRREMVAEHRGTSFETRQFLCLFSDERLPKQHFRL